MSHPDSTLSTSRVFPYFAEKIFSKYSDPLALTRWWGPHGNTNTFESFAFVEGGHWVFTMHSDGHDYANEWVFHKIEKNHILMEHTVAPIFTLEVILEALTEHTTKMTWIATFENPEFFAQMQDFLKEKNAENFDRLEEELTNF